MSALHPESIQPVRTHGSRRATLRESTKLTLAKQGIKLSTQSQLKGLLSPVGKQLLVFSLVMRLPSFMIALAVLLMMAHQTGEVSLGAYAAGVVALSSAAVHRYYRQFSGKFGYRGVLIVSSTLNIPAVAFLMIQTDSFSVSGAGGSMLNLLLASLLAGITTAPLGSMMRLFWSDQYSQREQRQTLIYTSAFESILDVVALPFAAAIVGLVSILGGIQSALFAVIIIDVVGIMFMLWKPASLDSRRLQHREVSSMPSSKYDFQQLGWLPMTGAAFIGIAIGATQSALVVRSVQTETLETVGIFLGVMGIAGAVTCVLLIVSVRRFASWEGWLLTAAFLVLSSLTLSIPQSAFWTIITLSFFGAAVGSALMCMDTLISRLSARGNIALAHSSTQSTYVGGLALGYVWAVILSDLTSQSAAMLVPLIAATLFFCTGHFFGYLWRKRFEERLHILKLD